MGIKIYTSRNCGPCVEIKEALEMQGWNIDGEPVQVMDVESDDGFADFSNNILEKQDAWVPCGYKDGQVCRLVITDQNIVALDCPKNGHSSYLPDL